jgi:hypothetical protein
MKSGKQSDSQQTQKKIPTKKPKSFYNENYKTLKKRIKDTRRWKNFTFAWIRRLVLLKWPYYRK